MSDEAAFEVVLDFGWARDDSGRDIAAVVREQLGDGADIEAVLDDDGAVRSYKLHMWFPTAVAAFDATLALRNFLEAEGHPWSID
jgi:hypothetical protein